MSLLTRNKKRGKILLTIKILHKNSANCRIHKLESRKLPTSKYIATFFQCWGKIFISTSLFQLDNMCFHRFSNYCSHGWVDARSAERGDLPWDWKMGGLSLMSWMKTVTGRYDVELSRPRHASRNLTRYLLAEKQKSINERKRNDHQN